MRGMAQEKASMLLDLQQEPESEQDFTLNYSSFAAVRQEQAEIRRMVSELRDLPLPPLD